MRRDDPIFRRQTFDDLSTAVLSPDCLAVRFAGGDVPDRLLIVNFGGELELMPVAEPLLAAPIDTQWQIAWQSNQLEYGGSGKNPVEFDVGWKIGAEAAIVLQPAKRLSDK
jgi:maltooligosyltrehalose trehalohydrolase